MDSGCSFEKRVARTDDLASGHDDLARDHALEIGIARRSFEPGQFSYLFACDALRTAENGLKNSALAMRQFIDPVILQLRTGRQWLIIRADPIDPGLGD